MTDPIVIRTSFGEIRTNGYELESTLKRTRSKCQQAQLDAIESLALALVAEGFGNADKLSEAFQTTLDACDNAP